MKEKIARAWLFGALLPLVVGFIGFLFYTLYETSHVAFFVVVAAIAVSAMTIWSLEQAL